MGVSSTGKSTVGEMFAQEIRAKFIDGDDLHPKANVLKMSQGEALNDQDRNPWLERIRDAAFSMEMKNERGVIVCSALKKCYRDKIREGNQNVIFLHLHADKAIMQSVCKIVKGTLCHCHCLMISTRPWKCRLI
ncbi:gluconokinase [Vibrio ishigakensis]|uniref:Gluconokinase n=1 Tax=Vibrio ishigakensis TaxID=1481914 RepID=A0A0B8PCD5_9VIBR|nr:gluconokinase [Vibrio ishigakensis]